MSPFPETRSHSSGDTLGRYQLLYRLAVGGMGEVFLARERGVAGVSRLVVVKLLLSELADAPEQVALFIDEARIAAQLAHPNIVQIYEFGNEGTTYFLAMEYVAGQNLARLCERAARNNAPYPRNTAAYVVAEMARGLHYAHNATDSHGQRLNIVHRDISPHNILVSDQGTVKLMDFGIAHSSARRQRTQTGVLRGKFSYMSPEQIEQRELDVRSDVFSAGIVLWETTLMRRLFAGSTELETVRLVARSEVPRPRSIEPNYPVDLEAVVMTALARDPADRFQTAGALAAALRNVLARQPAVEKDELGAWVTALFPDTLPDDLSAVVRRTTPMLERIPPVSADEPVVERALARSRTSRWRRVGLLGLAVASLMVVVIWLWQSATMGSRQRPVVASHAEFSDAAMSIAFDATEGDVRDAGSHRSAVFHVAYDSSVQPDARVRRSAGRGLPRRDERVIRGRSAPPKTTPADEGRQPVDTPPEAGELARSQRRPQEESTPLGRLAIASSPWGRVTINGRYHGHTNLVERLPSGTYRVKVALSDGSGTFVARARVEPNKKTKCSVRQESLRCSSPQ